MSPQPTLNAYTDAIRQEILLLPLLRSGSTDVVKRMENTLLGLASAIEAQHYLTSGMGANGLIGLSPSDGKPPDPTDRQVTWCDHVYNADAENELYPRALLRDVRRRLLGTPSARPPWRRIGDTETQEPHGEPYRVRVMLLDPYMRVYSDPETQEEEADRESKLFLEGDYLDRGRGFADYRLYRRNPEDWDDSPRGADRGYTLVGATNLLYEVIDCANLLTIDYVNAHMGRSQDADERPTDGRPAPDGRSPTQTPTNRTEGPSVPEPA